MSRKSAPQLIELPLSAKASGATAAFFATSTDHVGYATDAFKASWHANRRDSVARRNAVRQALIAKYGLQ